MIKLFWTDCNLFSCQQILFKDFRSSCLSNVFRQSEWRLLNWSFILISWRMLKLSHLKITFPYFWAPSKQTNKQTLILGDLRLWVDEVLRSFQQPEHFFLRDSPDKLRGQHKLQNLLTLARPVDKSCIKIWLDLRSVWNKTLEYKLQNKRSDLYCPSTRA